MAYVLSSVSGNLISAASAGYAPTNSGDVSAIASAYQVVSSTATQLYAGTAYLTSVNETPLSAARAGNAANASLANSAWYDGTGRLISALPDSAAVSAIASSYVESGVSSKQDTLSFAYNTADQISSINGSALGGMNEAAVSGIASAYAESAVSSVSGNYYTTANESGFLTAQAQASWSESASASPSYIQDKPDLVDIVAGPGIVIDNPDGNTLRVSVAQDVEVELFSGTATNTNVALSEALDNFERIKIYAYWNGTNTYDYYGYSVTEIYTSELSVGKRFTVNVFCNLNDSEFYSIANFSVASTKTQLNLVNVKRASLTEQLIAQNDGPTVYKVVGIHRIANN